MSEERTSFLRPKRSGSPHLQSTQAERSEADPHQSPNRKSEDQQTASNLAFSTLQEDQGKTRCTGIGIKTDLADSAGGGPSLFQGDAFLEASDGAFVKLTLHFDPVFAFVAKGGVK